jgi:hypothetical protein
MVAGAFVGIQIEATDDGDLAARALSACHLVVEGLSAGVGDPVACGYSHILENTRMPGRAALVLLSKGAVAMSTLGRSGSLEDGCGERSTPTKAISGTLHLQIILVFSRI